MSSPARGYDVALPATLKWRDIVLGGQTGRARPFFTSCHHPPARRRSCRAPAGGGHAQYAVQILLDNDEGAILTARHDDGRSFTLPGPRLTARRGGSWRSGRPPRGTGVGGGPPVLFRAQRSPLISLRPPHPASHFLSLLLLPARPLLLQVGEVGGNVATPAASPRNVFTPLGQMGSCPGVLQGPLPRIPGTSPCPRGAVARPPAGLAAREGREGGAGGLEEEGAELPPVLGCLGTAGRVAGRARASSAPRRIAPPPPCLLGGHWGPTTTLRHHSLLKDGGAVDWAAVGLGAPAVNHVDDGLVNACVNHLEHGEQRGEAHSGKPSGALLVQVRKVEQRSSGGR